MLLWSNPNNTAYRIPILVPGDDRCWTSCDITQEACRLAEHQRCISGRVAVSEIRRHYNGIERDRFSSIQL